MSAPTIDEWVQRVWALQSFGRTDDAIAEARQALAEHPGEAELLGSLAWLEFFYGDRARSEELAQQTLAARPGDWRGLNILLENAVARGDVAEGERIGREAVAAYPDGPDAHLALAYALAASRKESKADAKLRRSEITQQVAEAVELAPERVETLRRGSILLARAGNESASAQMLSRALALDPDNEDLLMLVGTSPDATEVQGLRVLSGVLTANPQQRQAARALNDIVWARTLWLAAISLLPLAGMMLFGYLLFGEDGLETTYRQRRQIVGIFGFIGFGWIVLYVYLRRALPKGYLRRLFGAVWWVHIGLVIAVIATIATMFIAFAFAVRGLPTQQRMAGSYIGGLTAMVDFVAWLVLIAELLVLFARFVSERRTNLFPGDAEGLAAAVVRRRSALISLAIRGGLALLFALVPVVAAGIATRPEAAGGFPAVAVAIAVPPLIWAALAAGDVWRIRAEVALASQVMPRVIVSLGVAVAVAAILGTWSIADWHAAQNDPPPTPYELEMQERTSQLQQSQSELQETLDSLNELNERLGQ